MAEGLNNRGIAKRLGLDEGTIKTYSAGIYRAITHVDANPHTMIAIMYIRGEIAERPEDDTKKQRREERKAQLAARKALNAAKKAERALSPKPFDDGRLHPRFQRIKRKAEAVGSNGFDPNHVAQLLGEYADPEYYNRSADVRMASPLAGMR